MAFELLVILVPTVHAELKDLFFESTMVAGNFLCRAEQGDQEVIGNLLSPVVMAGLVILVLSSVVMVRLPETVLVALSGKELVIGGESKVAGGCS